MLPDDDACYRAVSSRDRRFDGWFYVGVTSTGIFCRPSCPATTPKRANVRFYPSAAAAAGAGFRACRRCRPDTAPGSPAWNVHGDLAARAVTLIDDGLVDREGVGAVAARLAVSERHLHRILVAELGAPPVALARARRAQTARTLIETTELAFTEIAFAAGFASIRQFNDTVRSFFGASPTELRADRRTAVRRNRSTAHADASAGRHPSAGPTTISLRLPARPPLAAAELVGFLAARAVPGVEAAGDDGAFWRTLVLPHGPAVAVVRAGDDHVQVTLAPAAVADLGPAVARLRRLLDLDADPAAVDAALGADPHLGPLVATTPGRRSPGAVDGGEQLVRAIVGQQITVAGARTVLARLVAALGDPLPTSTIASLGFLGAPASLTATFPTAATIAGAPRTHFSMPTTRHAALATASAAVAAGELDLSPAGDRVQTRQRLLALRGIGPWTAEYVAMRALGDPDAFLPTDAGVAAGLRAIGLDPAPRVAAAHADRWRPWRSYAVHHLWAAAGGAPTSAVTAAPATTG